MSTLDKWGQGLTPLAKVTRQEWDAAPAPERVLAWKDLLLDPIRRAEHVIDLSHFVEALDTRANREDVVFLSRFNEQRSGRDQAGDVIHFCPVQNSWNVVVDAVGQAADAVAERVQVAAHECRADPRLEGCCEDCHSAAA